MIQNQLIRTLLLQKFDLKWKSGEKRKFEDDHVQSFSRLKDCYQKVQKIVPLLLTQTQLFLQPRQSPKPVKRICFFAPQEFCA